MKNRFTDLEKANETIDLLQGDVDTLRQQLAEAREDKERISELLEYLVKVAAARETGLSLGRVLEQDWSLPVNKAHMANIISAIDLNLSSADASRTVSPRRA